MPISESCRSTNSVNVSHIAARANKREIIAVFNTLIGDVCGSRETKDCGSALEITFANRDAATKALCMTGYTISGTPLNVSPMFLHGDESNTRFQRDDRRNLYVLGLPFSLTKTELSNMFTRYGTVTHCVILATLDNSSRRRGFVVMSCHEEAKHAIAALSCAQLSGHALDISWAVVQRSQGFLDGGDRLMALDSRPSSRVNFRRNHYAHSPASSTDSSLDSNELDYSSLVSSAVPTSTLLVSNLPTLLFSQLQDLQPLFVPYGSLKDLRIVEKLPTGSTSVIVDYATAMAAKEAKESLTGQRYADYQVKTCYVRSDSPISYSLQKPSFPGFKNNILKYSEDPNEYSYSLPSGPVGHKSWQYLNDSQPRIRAIHITQQHNQEQASSSRCGSISRWSSDFNRNAFLTTVNTNSHHNHH